MPDEVEDLLERLATFKAQYFMEQERARSLDVQVQVLREGSEDARIAAEVKADLALEDLAEAEVVLQSVTLHLRDLAVALAADEIPAARRWVTAIRKILGEYYGMDWIDPT